MGRAEAYKERLDALGSMFEFDVTRDTSFEVWNFHVYTGNLIVRAVLRFQNTELTLLYRTQNAERPAPETILEMLSESVKHALMHPKAQCFMPAAQLTYTMKEVVDEVATVVSEGRG